VQELKISTSGREQRNAVMKHLKVVFILLATLFVGGLLVLPDLSATDDGSGGPRPAVAGPLEEPCRNS
jgi:hypothetical protein